MATPFTQSLAEDEGTICEVQEVLNRRLHGMKLNCPSKITCQDDKARSYANLRNRLKMEKLNFRLKLLYLTQFQHFKNSKFLSYDKKIIMFHVLFAEPQRVNFEPLFKFLFP